MRINYLLIILFLTVFTSCERKKKKKIEVVIVKEDVAFLADDKLEGRQTVTDGKIAAAAYIAKRFEDLGLTAKGTKGYLQAFTFRPKTDSYQDLNYTAIDGDSTITGINVIGFLDNKEENTITIGAHYDYLGY